MISTLNTSLTSSEPDPGTNAIWVGPGGNYAELHEVPWQTLAGGTTVMVLPRADAYRSFVRLCTNDVTLRGVRDSAGNRPRLEADGAFLGRSGLSDHQSPFGLVQVFRRDDDWRSFPTGVRIEGLRISGAGAPGSKSAAGLPFDPGAAGVRIERGHNIVLRDCEITDNGNGVFSRSYNDPAFEWTGITIVEGCYIHGNNRARTPGVHNMYMQDGLGTIVQACRIENAGGSGIKCRSSWFTGRYNYIAGNKDMAIDLVEPEDHAATVVLPMDPDLVYGNLISCDAYREAQSIPLNFGMDHFGIIQGLRLVQRASCDFAYNTVRLVARERLWSAAFLRPSTVQQQVLFANNLCEFVPNGFGVDGGLDVLAYGEPRPAFEQGGTLYWGNNALPSGWRINAAAKEPDRGIVLGPDGELGRHHGKGASFISNYTETHPDTWRPRRVTPASTGGLSVATEAPRPSYQFDPTGPVANPLQCLRQRFGYSSCGARE